MKSLSRDFIGILVIAFALIFFGQTALAQDVVKVAPDVKVLLENDRVRVLESTCGKCKLDIGPA